VPKAAIAAILRTRFVRQTAAMKIEKNRVVQFHYTLTDEAGVELESSSGREMMAYLAGTGGIIPGLESALEGKQAGDKLEVSVNPDQAYGERREGFEQRVPKKHFKNVKLVPGMTVVVPTQQGQRPVTIKKVGMSVVDVDLNHPMAGKVLNFSIDIVNVREATAEEIEHRHVHGEGGHKHD
jgi:FKBP-type peptidyl-prolyl cis-trans isomerase SlyD